MRIGLFGGAFDPFHNGHKAIIEAAIESNLVDYVFVVPSVSSPFKPGNCLNAAPYRYYMTSDAIDEISVRHPGKVYICDVEFYLEGVSFTLKMLELLQSKRYFSAFLEKNDIPFSKEDKISFSLICGSDILFSFDKWFEPKKIVSLAPLMVALRPGDDASLVPKQIEQIEAKYATNVTAFSINSIDISSSFIRNELNFDDVPKAVDDFIKLHDLYDKACLLQLVSDDCYKQFLKYSSRLYFALSRKRLLHSLDVALLAVKYASLYGENTDKALVAGCLHDCAKELPLQKQKEYAKTISGDVFDNVKLIHSPAGKYVAMCEYGVTDEDVLNAIIYHTTAHSGMSTLEKIVFLADKLEPSRNYDDLTLPRQLALQDLDVATYVVLSRVKEKFDEYNVEVHKYTLECLDELQRIGKTCNLSDEDDCDVEI